MLCCTQLLEQAQHAIRAAMLHKIVKKGLLSVCGMLCEDKCVCPAPAEVHFDTVIVTLPSGPMPVRMERGDVLF